MIIGLFRTIAVILLVYFVCKIISRFILPFFLRGYVKNLHQKVQEESLRQKNRKKEGEISINYAPDSKKNVGKNEGDYVDFEEIK
ncbi:MAG: DUF4834 family protein [Bacteroidales bacterium]|jgi:hypothetical protein|nr:DUF4834 family protein [Bacteroidales bacterium]